MPYGIRGNIFAYNKITNNNFEGIHLDGEYNNLFKNTISNHSNYGIYLENYTDDDNFAYHNNFLNNTKNVYSCSRSSWNLSYPICGDYWDDHPDFIDDFSGPNQDIPGSDGICDNTYDIPKWDTDHYPLVAKSVGIIPLSADSYGPYDGFVSYNVTFRGDAFGGIPPYTWHWDFGDGNTSILRNPKHIYSTIGQYDLILTVVDSEGNTTDDTTIVYIADELVNADAGGPYEGIVGIPVQFYGSASGGFPPYTWDWSFGDGEHSDEQNPTNTYHQTGTYDVRLKVVDKFGNWDWDFTTVTISEDNTPPSVSILKPENAIYIINKKIMPLLLKSLIIGSIDIEVNATDDLLGVDKVEIYIDNKLKTTDTSEPYSWTWDERTPFRFRHMIKVIAYDVAGNNASDEITVWKFF